MLNRSMRKYSVEERHWLNLFLHSPLPYVKELYHQMKACDVEREECLSHYYIYFHFSHEVPTINVALKMPVCIDLCQNPIFSFEDEKIIKYFQKTGMMHFLEDTSVEQHVLFKTNPDTQYYSANLFFTEGVISELEIIEWNGRPIEKKTK